MKTTFLQITNVVEVCVGMSISVSSCGYLHYAGVAQ